jgi:hypothetical protein
MTRAPCDLIANRKLEQYPRFMLLIGAVFVLILGVTYFIPVVLPGLVMVAVGAGASIVVSKILFWIFRTPEQ